MVAIRICLRSAPCVERPHRPVSGKSAYLMASFRLTASRAFYAVPKHAGSRIKLNLSHLTKGTGIASLRDHPCDASCGKALRMRHKISSHRRNQLKMSILKPHE